MAERKTGKSRGASGGSKPSRAKAASGGSGTQRSKAASRGSVSRRTSSAASKQGGTRSAGGSSRTSAAAKRGGTRGAGGSDSGEGGSRARQSESSSSGSGSSRSNGRGGMTALDAARAARESLAALLDRPVETVLGIDREHGSWVVKAQVLELARVPNTTDVLGEYEAVLDGRGELVRYSRTGRYHRGQVDSER